LRPGFAGSALRIRFTFRTVPAPGSGSPSVPPPLEELRQMAREAVRVYKLGSPIEVVLRPLQSSGLTSYAGVGMSFSPVRGQVSVDPRVLESPTRHTLMAVVLASIMLGTPSTATTLADYERERQAAVREVNAKAVEVLVRVRGVAEAEAWHSVYTWLLALHRSSSRRTGAAGSLAPCDQIRDLL